MLFVVKIIFKELLDIYCIVVLKQPTFGELGNLLSKKDEIKEKKEFEYII